MGDLIQLPNVKAAVDERGLLDEVLKMLASGQDGVEAGLSTTEFWLTATAVVIDVAGPHYGFLQGINPDEQAWLAAILVMGYGALRSWRKRGGPAKLLASVAYLAHKGPGGPTAPDAPPAAAVEAPKPA